MGKLRRVAIVAETGIAPRRRLLAGIARYMREHEPWAIYLKPQWVARSLGSWLSEWDGDGIIAAAWGAEAAALTVSPTKIPLVDITGQLVHLGVPHVRTDDEAVGWMAAEHLLDRNFRSLAFVGYPVGWSRLRYVGFEARLRERGAGGVGGMGCLVHEVALPAESEGGPRFWEAQQGELLAWIKTLPRPVGILAATDMLGQQVLESCQRCGAVVPEEVAVIGADNDELICEICCPPLSSVIIDDFRRGYETAALLARLMEGEQGRGKGKGKVIVVPPAGVVCRASTDILAIEDKELAQAVQFIREHACEQIGVEDVLRQVVMSRRSMERRFRMTLGRSVNDEIVRVRLAKAVDLLTATDLGIKQVAAKVGFRSGSYMGTVFRKRLGRTPGSYRPGLA